jgi:hypothetical protein
MLSKCCQKSGIKKVKNKKRGGGFQTLETPCGGLGPPLSYTYNNDGELVVKIKSGFLY